MRQALNNNQKLFAIDFIIAFFKNYILIILRQYFIINIVQEVYFQINFSD